ncbi:hypothetical protein I4U23_027044 [Adineta vaga]|nr:hypothetical protein I4U23_027044 [Adineta vaga]
MERITFLTIPTPYEINLQTNLSHLRYNQSFQTSFWLTKQKFHIILSKHQLQSQYQKIQINWIKIWIDQHVFDKGFWQNFTQKSLK